MGVQHAVLENGRVSGVDTPGGSGAETPSATPQCLGLKAAAKYAGVAVSTLQRRRDELELYGATKDESGWRIPVTALVSMGLIDAPNHPADTPDKQRVSGVDTPGGSGTETPSATPREEPIKSEVIALQEQLAEMRQEAAVARAERDAERRRADEHLERARDAERRLDSMITNQTALTLTVSEQHKALMAPMSENPTDPEPLAPKPAPPSQPLSEQPDQAPAGEVFTGRVRRWFKK